MDLSALINALPAKYATLALAFCGLCAAVAMFLPAPKTPGSAYARIYSLVNLLGANAGHAANATAPKVLLALVLLPLALAACTTAQIQDVQTKFDAAVKQVQQVAAVACHIDGQVQPVVVNLAAPVVTAVVPSAAPVISGLVVFDMSSVHPLIVKACADLGGSPVGGVPAT